MSLRVESAILHKKSLKGSLEESKKNLGESIPSKDWDF